MNVHSLTYNDHSLLSIEYPPSRYLLFPMECPILGSWQISMADNSIRDMIVPSEDLLPTPSNGTSFEFNILKSLGGTVEEEPRSFLNREERGSSLYFSSPQGSLDYIPSLFYAPSELSIIIGLSLQNLTHHTIYWRPSLHCWLNVPWNHVSIEHHLIKCLAKKRLRLAEDFEVIHQVKNTERTSCAVLSEEIVGFSQLQSSHVWIGSGNEEEGIRCGFLNKSTNQVIAFKYDKKLNKTKASFLSNVPLSHEMNIEKAQLASYAAIQPLSCGTFAIELQV